MLAAKQSSVVKAVAASNQGRKSALLDPMGVLPSKSTENESAELIHAIPVNLNSLC